MTWFVVVLGLLVSGDPLYQLYSVLHHTDVCSETFLDLSS